MPATQRKYIWRLDTGCGPTLYETRRRRSQRLLLGLKDNSADSIYRCMIVIPLPTKLWWYITGFTIVVYPSVKKWHHKYFLLIYNVDTYTPYLLLMTWGETPFIEAKMSKVKVKFGVWTLYRFCSNIYYVWTRCTCVAHDLRKTLIDFWVKRSKVEVKFEVWIFNHFGTVTVFSAPEPKVQVHYCDQ